MSKLNYLCISAVTFLITATFSISAMAQSHGAGVFKNCPSISKIGDETSCILSVRNQDEFGDTVTVTDFWDTVAVGTAWAFRNPATGNLPIVAVSEGVTCAAATPGPDAPIGLVFPCDIDGIPTAAGGGGSAFSIDVESTFTIPGDFVPANPDNPQLPDQANVTVFDNCDLQQVGCSSNPNTLQFTAAVSLFTASLEVTKEGEDVSKVGDTVTYTIGFVDTSTSLTPDLVNCTGTDTVLGDLGDFVSGVPRDFDYIVQPGDPDPLVNVATITCDVDGFDNQASGSDDHTLDLIEPGLLLEKTGPETAKVGDEILYEYCLTNTGTADLDACVVIDSELGDIGGPGLIVPAETVCGGVFYVVQPGDPNPLVNVATATCNVVGFDNQAISEDDWSVDLIDPAVDLTKTGPAEAKVGDTISYDFLVENTGSAALENCVLTDDLITLSVAPFSLLAGESYSTSADYMVMAGDPDQLVNNASVTCDVVGFDNSATAADDHTVDLFVVAANLAKVCYDDPVSVGGDINWDITINNTGEKDINCLVDDSTAGFTAEPVSVAAGGSETITASRTVVVEDAPAILNTATATCTVPGYDNTLDLGPAEAECEVQNIVQYCRTPGFWKTHGGAEKAGRSTNLVREVINEAGGSLGEICGVVIDNTSVNGYSDVPAIEEGDGNGSALEGMCVHPKTEIVRQLQRQLIAASLNCVVSGAPADCTGVTIGEDWAMANQACIDEADDMSDWIDVIDDFNNGEDDVCMDGIQNADMFQDVDYKVPGPAGSSNACSAATSNDFYLVPMP